MLKQLQRAVDCAFGEGTGVSVRPLTADKGSYWEARVFSGAYTVAVRRSDKAKAMKALYRMVGALEVGGSGGLDWRVR
jgi:hypothetical protein